MEYVMVPVPEQLVPEVKQFLQWNTSRNADSDLDEDGARRFVESLDELERRFLLIVAHAAADVKVMTTEDVAEAVGCTVHEVIGLLMTLNTKVLIFGQLPWGLVLRSRIEGSEDEHGVPRYTINMAGGVAQAIVTAAQPEVAGS